MESQYAKFARERISKEFDVRCLVDLSAVPVFEDFGIYNILLVLEKRIDHVAERASAQIVRCQDFAGPALQACLEGRTVETPYYSVFEVGQDFFDREK
jgi:hypothetical protein